MNVIVRFADGSNPQTVEASTAPEALRQVDRADAYVAIRCVGGYELLHFCPETQRFSSTLGYSVSQAFETLFDREATL